MSCSNTSQHFRFGALLGSTLLSMLLVAACGGSETPRADEPTGNPGEDDEVEQDDSPPTERRSRVPGMDDEDEDDDENLEIEGLKGHLDPYDIQKGVEPKSAELADCFESRARKARYLGGNVELLYTVARDGSVKQVRLGKSDVGSWEVEKCLIDVSMAMSFKKPKGGEADFSLPLEFQARGNSLWWSEQKAEEELGERPLELNACSTETGAKEPVNVWVTLYLAKRGAVPMAGFASPHKDGIDPAWADCALAKMQAWTLSDPRGKVAKLGFRYNPE